MERKISTNHQRKHTISHFSTFFESILIFQKLPSPQSEERLIMLLTTQFFQPIIINYIEPIHTLFATNLSSLESPINQ